MPVLVGSGYPLRLSKRGWLRASADRLRARGARSGHSGGDVLLGCTGRV